MDTLRYLRTLHDSLSPRQGAQATPGYTVPAAWLPPDLATGPTIVDPYQFYREVIRTIIDSDPVDPVGTHPADHSREAVGAGQGGRGAQWSREAVVYNLLVRFTCAYDHDGDGEIAHLNAGGWREGGSFLKAIALLRHIRALGANTIHLLPVQEIGRDGRRGALGSPYAVRDPLALDGSLGEPNTGLDTASQFAAFLEAARHSGFRTILELPLRTLSKDCVWAEDHPEWFYWIDADVSFRPPVFPESDIRAVREKIGAGNHVELPPPPLGYRSQFSVPPPTQSVRRIGDRWTGTTPDGRRVVIPGAFADWPPDDQQPVWDDVTYLKFFQDERFNYPAYNTIRMYDSRLIEGDTATGPLWNLIEEVVTHYASLYRMDGLMIDMAHAIPGEMAMSLVRRVRTLKPDFAFWAEDFSRNEGQVRLGFDVVLGGQWACQHRMGDFTDMLEWIGHTPDLLPHLATPETHNTPRAVTRTGGERFSRYAWTVSCFIPGVPFIHSGFELYESRPVNTGLGFRSEELALFPTELLPLFNAHQLRWDEAGLDHDWVRRPLDLRTRFKELILPGHGADFRLIQEGDPRILAFVRTGQGRALVVAANSDMDNRLNVALPAGFTGSECADLLSGNRFRVVDGRLEGVLEPGQVAIFTIPPDEGA